jgi:hypothetical protein
MGRYANTMPYLLAANSRVKPAPKFKITSRQQLIRRIKNQLESRGYPRLQMMLLVALTGGAGFLASYSLLRSGIDTLAVRYPLAVGAAYIAFLLLLWLWLRTKPDDYEGLDEVASDIFESLPEGAGKVAARYQGGGGQFGGGGSSGRWDSRSDSESLVELPDVSVANIADADELAVPLAVILFIAGLLLTVFIASASVIYSAPVLFAELLLDGVLAATLYRRLRRIHSRHWLESAVRRTIVPFAITAMSLAVAGWGMSIYAPEARTIGDVLEQL